MRTRIALLLTCASALRCIQEKVQAYDMKAHVSEEDVLEFGRARGKQPQYAVSDYPLRKKKK